MVGRAKKQGAEVIRLADRAYGNEAIVNGLIEGDSRAAAALYDRFGDNINRLVWRLLGADSEHDDVVHQVFVNVLSSIKKLKNHEALEEWITGVTVNTVRREIRSRKYRRILIPGSDYPERAVEHDDIENKVVVNRLFEILDKMNTEDHIVFVLRFVERNTLGEVAMAGGYSLATAKRRVTRAKREFVKKARRDSVLSPFLKDIGHV